MSTSTCSGATLGCGLSVRTSPWRTWRGTSQPAEDACRLRCRRRRPELSRAPHPERAVSGRRDGDHRGGPRASSLAVSAVARSCRGATRCGTRHRCPRRRKNESRLRSGTLRCDAAVRRHSSAAPLGSDRIPLSARSHLARRHAPNSGRAAAVSRVQVFGDIAICHRPP